MPIDHMCACYLQIIVENSLIFIMSSSRPNAIRENWGSKSNARDVGRVTCYSIRSVPEHARYRIIASGKIRLFLGTYKSFIVLIL